MKTRRIWGRSSSHVFIWYGGKDNPNRNFSYAKSYGRKKAITKKGAIGYEGEEFIATQNISCEARIRVSLV